MKVSGNLHLDSDIVYLNVLDDANLAIVTQDRVFNISNLETMQTKQEFVFNNASVHSKKNNVAFSPDGKYLAYSEKEQSVVRVINIHSHKLHHSFPTLKNRVETLCFDPSSRYLIAGSLTGRVYLWNLVTTGQVSRLSSFPEYTPHLLTQPKVNYVSAACFSPSGNLVATSGYGGSIVVTNIYTEVSPKRITPNHVRINTMSFIHENLIVSGNIEGALDIIDLHSAQIQKHYQTGLATINNIAVSSSGRFLLVAGRTRSIILIDLKKQKIRDTDYITRFSKITQLAMTKDDILAVGCADGSVTMYQLSPEDSLQSYINANAYDQAYALIQEYPFLEDSTLMQELEKEWEATLDEALVKIEEGKNEDALVLLQKFSKIPSKFNAIKDIRNVIKNFQTFNSAVLGENYTLAYSLAEQVPLLKRTEAYARTEDAWDASFLQAQAYVIQNQKRKLVQTLEPFGRAHSKLCFIQVLLHQPELFLEFTNHVNNHDYDKIFSIAYSYPCLKEIQSYQELLRLTQELHEKSRQHIFNSQYDLAELELEQLSHVPSMKTQVKELRHILTLAIQLDHLYTQEDILACYALIDRNPVLEVIQTAKDLEETWNNKIELAQKEALLGHVKEVKSILGELFLLSSRSQKIGTILRSGFLTQLKFLVIKHQTDSLPKAINNYIDLFGYDTELNNLIQKIKQDKIIDINLTDEQMQHRSRSLWLRNTEGKIPDTILQAKS